MTPAQLRELEALVDALLVEGDAVRDALAKRRAECLDTLEALERADLASLGLALRMALRAMGERL